MASKKVNYIKLGLFMMAGLAVLVLLLYVIGKNQDLFGKTFLLKARFENVYGLMPGNNIRFSGIDAGSVKNIEVINDTTIEVTLLVKTKMKSFIHKNAIITIGTDGLMGNKLVNIQSAKAPAPEVEEGDVLSSSPSPDTEEMLKVLSATNNDIASIAKTLKQTLQRINESKAVWGVLDDASLPADIRRSLSRVKNSAEYMNRTMADLYAVVNDVKEGKGTVGKLLKDTAIAANVHEAIDKIKGIGFVADSLSMQISSFVSMLNQETSNGNGTVHALLKDKEMADRLNNTIKNIEQDTKSFNEVMDAVKQSFLFRGYFKKLEKKKKQQSAISPVYEEPFTKNYLNQ